ncbi:RNA polymerase sigma factor (sigma-70 family) [Kitasatospora sp. MAA4]|uniref:sigma-70 family RNA polymerase sigma factor n=1 Tax=Kitasatospora sp. MAA4 TaxID=3035093 RepID=UPI0024739CD5|nr:sigma-70 family RNA polymerase sigma factor [Kitasatospora sp. MAA4]MDH6136754.1 RNA polymerase sigma factor (sigma-70 family) [Kitasatospora sp. MAA4]
MGTDSHRAGAAGVRVGDRDALIAGHLQLVYNIVGRALNGHPDTDDVVQETMLRAVDGLDGLREPTAFRSWLVAIAMNQIRRRYRDRQAHAGAGPLDEVHGLADPDADFVGLTIVRLGLAGQRREVAEATRWLDPEDRELLALWWQEAAGELSRAELAAALDLSPAHTGVRVQRMKERLDTARVVVRALAGNPPCPELAAVTAAWDGVPEALWRKRIARHARDCGACGGHARDLVPAEGLLAGLALLPLPRHFAGQLTAATGTPGTPVPRSRSAGHRAGGSSRRRPAGGRRRRSRPSGRRRAATALGLLAALTAAGLGWHSLAPGQGTPVRASGGVVAQPELVDALAMQGASAAPAPTSAPPSPSITPTPSHSPTPSPSPSHSISAARPSANAAGTFQQQVLALVNIQRSQNGCGPLTANSKLQAAAQGQSDDMAARHFFDHTNPDGAGPQQRIEAAGYQWSTWGENIAQGQPTPASVMDSWMQSPGHRANILNCDFKELGVGVHQGPGGPWWTQDFGTPA